MSFSSFFAITHKLSVCFEFGEAGFIRQPWFFPSSEQYPFFVDFCVLVKEPSWLDLEPVLLPTPGPHNSLITMLFVGSEFNLRLSVRSLTSFSTHPPKQQPCQSTCKESHMRDKGKRLDTQGRFG